MGLNGLRRCGCAGPKIARYYIVIKWRILIIIFLCVVHSSLSMAWNNRLTQFCKKVLNYDFVALFDGPPYGSPSLYFTSLIQNGLKLNFNEISYLTRGGDNHIYLYTSNHMTMALRLPKRRDFTERDLKYYKEKEKYGGNEIYGLVPLGNRMAIGEKYLDDPAGFHTRKPTVRHCRDIERHVLAMARDNIVIAEYTSNDVSRSNYYLTQDGRVILHDVNILPNYGKESYEDLLKRNARIIFPQFIEDCPACKFLASYF